jgi:hypothetical protein
MFAIEELRATNEDEWHRLCAARQLYLQRRDATHWYRMLRHHVGAPDQHGQAVAAECDAYIATLGRVAQAHLALVCEQMLEEKRCR